MSVDTEAYCSKSKHRSLALILPGTRLVGMHTETTVFPTPARAQSGHQATSGLPGSPISPGPRAPPDRQVHRGALAKMGAWDPQAHRGLEASQGRKGRRARAETRERLGRLVRREGRAMAGRQGGGDTQATPGCLDSRARRVLRVRCSSSSSSSSGRSSSSNCSSSSRISSVVCKC